MAQNSPQKVSCLCGADVRVDPLSQDRRVTCKACSSTFDFVVTMDASRKNTRLSLILPPGALSLPESPKPTKVPETPKVAKPVEMPAAEAPAPRAVTNVPKKTGGKTMRAIIAKCECGATFPLEDNGELTTVQSCPQCKRSYHVVFKLEPGTRKKVAIVVPQKPIVHRGEMIRTVAAPKPKAVTQAPKPLPRSTVSGKKNRTIKVVRDPAVPKAPVEVPVGAQAVPCSCGATFIVRRRDLDTEKTCETCGKPARFREDRDPQTMAPVIRLRTM